MSKLFKFTPTKLNNIPPHDRRSKSTNNEVSDTEVQGLKLLIGKSNACNELKSKSRVRFEFQKIS